MAAKLPLKQGTAPSQTSQFVAGTDYMDGNVGGTSQVTTVLGDVLIGAGGAPPTWTRLAIGTTGYALTVSGGTASWNILGVAGGGLGVATWTAAGGIPYSTGATSVAILAAGTAGQVLTMNAGATAPVWTDPSSASFDISLTSGEGVTSFVIGNLGYISAASTIKLTKANAVGTMPAYAVATGTVAAGASGTFRTGGRISATTAQWNSVTDSGAGGLVAGTFYYADPSNFGKWTQTQPTTVGQFSQPCGEAESTTVMKLLFHPMMAL